MMLGFSVPAMAYSSNSPTAAPVNEKSSDSGSADSERKSPNTGEAPIMLGFGAAAAVSAAGIAVYMKKQGRNA